MPNSKPKPKIKLPARPKQQRYIPDKGRKLDALATQLYPEEPHNPIVALTLDNNHRYAHTASCAYQLTMASLQPDSRRLPHCACNVINEEKRDKSRTHEHRVVVIVEHNLAEHILCILDSTRLNQCKLNLIVQPGEQIAFRTIGKIPVQLTGFILSEGR